MAVPSLVYDSETWDVPKQNPIRITAGEKRFFGNVKQSTRDNRVSNHDKREELETTCVMGTIEITQKSWTGFRKKYLIINIPKGGESLVGQGNNGRDISMYMESEQDCNQILAEERRGRRFNIDARKLELQ